MSSEFRSKQVHWHVVVVWVSMGNTAQAETEGESSRPIIETLYKNVKGLDPNSHKLCNMILCSSDFLGDSVDNGLEWHKEFQLKDSCI